MQETNFTLWWREKVGFVVQQWINHSIAVVACTIIVLFFCSHVDNYYHFEVII